MPHDPSALAVQNRREHSREFLAECLDGALIHLTHAADHLALGDDAGLRRSLQKFGAFTRAGLATFGEMTRERAEPPAASIDEPNGGRV